MFIDPKTSKASLKQSERNQLVVACLLLRQIGKYAGLRAADAAAGSIEVTLDEISPPTKPDSVAASTEKK